MFLGFRPAPKSGFSLPRLNLRLIAQAASPPLYRLDVGSLKNQAQAKKARGVLLTAPDQILKISKNKAASPKLKWTPAIAATSWQKARASQRPSWIPAMATKYAECPNFPGASALASLHHDSKARADVIQRAKAAIAVFPLAVSARRESSRERFLALEKFRKWRKTGQNPRCRNQISPLWPAEFKSISACRMSRWLLDFASRRLSRESKRVYLRAASLRRIDFSSLPRQGV